MRPLVEPHLKELVPYVPGKPIEETEREYGITGIAKLASNENCLGPSPRAMLAIKEAASSAHLYPDADCFYLKQRIALRHAAHGVTPKHVVVGNGTNEIITLLTRALLGEGETTLIGWPSFAIYRMAAKGCARREIAVPLDGELRYDLDAMARALAESELPVKVVFLANPNNPTGRYFSERELERFLPALPPGAVLVLDEAYAEYVQAHDYPDGVALAMKRPRTVVLRTFSKVFGLAALRVGYAVCDPDVADVLNRVRDPFNVNSLAQAAARAALDDDEHVARSTKHNAAELPRLSSGLGALGLSVWPSVANFVLADLAPAMPSVDHVNEALLRRGVIVRPVKNYGLPRSLRVTVGTRAENERLLAALGAVLDESAR